MSATDGGKDWLLTPSGHASKLLAVEHGPDFGDLRWIHGEKSERRVSTSKPVMAQRVFRAALEPRSARKNVSCLLSILDLAEDSRDVSSDASCRVRRSVLRGSSTLPPFRPRRNQGGVRRR